MKRLVTMALAMCLMCAALASTAVAADGDRMYFIAVGKLTDKMHDPANAGLLGQHIEYLGKLYDSGNLLLAGPFADDSGEGLIVLKAASLDEAHQLLMADPSISGGLIEPVSLHPLYAAFSKPDNHRFTADELKAMMSGGGEGMASANKGAASSTPAPDTTGGSAPGSASYDSGSNGMMAMTPGAVNFIQIPTSDAAASGTFYSTVFGWQVMPDPDHNMTFFTAPGGMMGEFSTESKPAAAMTGPVFFINCSSVKDMLPKVTGAGGQVYAPEMALPEDWGHIAIIGDSSGNAVGIWSTGE